MTQLELPHSAGCLVCGPDNARGLHLSFFVDEASGVVSTRFVPEAGQTGFEGLVHGGALATVVDEAMVWAATWEAGRFCVCAEFTTRFRRNAPLGRLLIVSARVESARSRLVQTSAEVLDEGGELIATGSGKYVPLSPERHQAFVATLLEDSATAAALRLIRSKE